MSSFQVPTLDTSKNNAALFGANRALRLREAVPRGVALWIRQSSSKQVIKNIGSQLFQKGLLAFLKHFGVDLDGVRQYVTTYDALGRSAREGVHRPDFERLLENIQAGEVGVVLVAFLDRHSRNKRDSQRLYDALAAQGGIVVQQGNIYDPCNETDRFFLEMQSLMAWFDNAQRSLRLLTSKASLAAALRLRIALPRGLCWASPDDPRYVRCAEEAGMRECISPEALNKHRVRTRDGAQELYILPYPDAELQKAVKLTAEWVLETRSLREVIRRVADHPAWPRPGQFPKGRSRLFRADDQQDPAPHKGLWRPLVGRSDGRDDLAPGIIRDWLRSPALYGIYSYDLPSLRKKSPAAADAIGATTWEVDAFPALIPAERRNEIEGILNEPLDAFVNGHYSGPRNHALGNVRCATFLPNGEICGLKSSTAYRSARRSYQYVRTSCTQRGHQGAFSSVIEGPVLDMITEAYGQGELEKALTHIRERRGVAAESRHRITREVKELEGQVESASHLLERAQRRNQYDVVEHWTARLEEHLQRKGELQRELIHLERQVERAGALKKQDLARLRALATDIPRVLELAAQVEEKFADPGEERAARHEGLQRRIVAQLTRAVHVRSLGFRCLDVQVEFPSGARRRRVVFVRAARVPQPAAVFASLHLGDRPEPQNRVTLEADEAVRKAAGEVARRHRAALQAAGRSNDPEWDADRVLTAALQLAHLPPEVAPRPKPSAHETVEQLANRTSVPEEVVLGTALTGALGPARVRDGRLVLRPSRTELHEAFPVVARRAVAESEGWDVNDTALLAEIRSERDWGWKETRNYAVRWSHIARDEAGRRYTCRSALPPAGREALMGALTARLPGELESASGRWLPLPQAVDELGVHRMTILKYRTDGATVVRPGRGYCGERSVYVWVDADFARLCADVSR